MSMTSRHPTEVAASFAFAVLPPAAFTQVLQTLIQSFHCFTDFSELNKQVCGCDSK